MEDLRETRHKKVLEWQRSKFERLWHKKQHGGNSHKNLKNDHSNQVQTPSVPSVLYKQWAVNLSSTPPIWSKGTLLAHGPNFAVTPKTLHTRNSYQWLEIACQSLHPTDAEQLRADVSRILKKSRTPPTANLTREEFRAMKELKSDRDHIILTADKGVALIVMDKSDYIRKMTELLEDTKTYRPLKMDPTIQQKSKLINILRRIKTEYRNRRYHLQKNVHYWSQFT